MALALYYPSMHFDDEDWLKLALLRWDTIARIRPGSAGDADSATVRMLARDTDALMDLTPSYHDLDLVAGSFFSVLGQFAPQMNTYGFASAVGPGRATRQRSGPTRGRGDALQHLRLGAPSSYRTDDLYWVYSEEPNAKIHSALQRELLTAGLAFKALAPRIDAVLSPGDWTPAVWLGMHPQLGRVYMAALADAVSRHNSLSPVTSSLRMYRALGALDQLADLLAGGERLPGVANAEDAYAHLSLTAALHPKNISEVPMSSILKFRERHRSDLALYRSHLASLADELRTAASTEQPNIARSHLLHIYETTTRPQVEELQRSMRAFGIESLIGAMELKVDLGAASGTALGAAATAAGHPVAGAAALGLTIVPFIAGRVSELQRRREASPAAYLLKVQRELR